MSRSRRFVLTAAVAVVAVAAAVIGIVLAAQGDDDDAAVTPAPVQTAAGAAVPTAPPTTPVWGFLRSDTAASPIGEVQVPADAVQSGSWKAVPSSAEAKASVVRTGSGRYSVTFPGTAVPGGLGAAVVTPVGSPGAAEVPTCHVVDWNASGTDEKVDVACRTSAGADLDAAFTAMFTYAPDSHRPDGGQPYAYLRDDAPSQDLVEPGNGYSFTGPGTIKINRVGVGHYNIDLIGGGYARTGNNMQVNAVGNSEAGCNALGREAKADRQVIFVGCAVGKEWTDTPFVVVYGNQHGLLPVENYPFGHAFNGITVSGSPAMQAPIGSTVDAWIRYSANTAAETNTVRRLEVGRYEVTFPGVGLSPDHVQVTPYGEPTARCALDGWTSAPAGSPPADVTVSFHCVGPGGTPVDTFASVAYVSATEGAAIAPARSPEPPPPATASPTQPTQPASPTQAVTAPSPLSS